MSFVTNLVLLAVSFGVFHYVDAQVSNSKIPNEKFGCPDVYPFRFWNFRQCDTDSDKPCRESQICCPTEFGSSCKVPTYIKPSPIKGCPPINTELRCIWFNEQCDNDAKRCPAGSICCGDNCGTTCVEQKREPSPVKGCPAIDTSVQCVWYNEQCNETTKPCPKSSICCGNNCGTSCIQQE